MTILTDRFLTYLGGGDPYWARDLSIGVKYMYHYGEYIVDDNGDMLFVEDDDLMMYFEESEEDIDYGDI